MSGIIFQILIKEAMKENIPYICKQTYHSWRFALNFLEKSLEKSKLGERKNTYL